MSRDEKTERLQKILARAGVASRRRAEELIAAGEVTVNGQVASLGDSADPERDAIKVAGKRVQPQRGDHHYLLLNKPAGYMSTRSDPEGRPTVLDLVPPQLRKALVPVGRLDFHTEGLLLLTDDGELAHRVGHPRHGCTKTYEVKVKDRPSAEALERLRRQGEVIEGRRVVPVRVDPLRPSGPRSGKNTWWTVEVSEGRTRMIREIFFRMGHPVQRLRRVAIGPVSDRGLPTGALRELTDAEVEKLRQATRGGGAGKAAGKKPAKARTKTATKKPGEAPATKGPKRGAGKGSATKATGPGSKPGAKPGARAAGKPRTGGRGRGGGGSRGGGGGRSGGGPGRGGRGGGAGRGGRRG